MSKNNLSFKDLKKLSKQDSTALQQIKVALLGDSATQLLATSLQGIAVARNYALDLFEAEYNQVERQVLDPTSELHSFNAQITVIFQSTHKFLTAFEAMAPQERTMAAEKRIEFLKDAVSLLQGKIIIYNYPEIDDAVFGSYGNKVETSFVYQTRKLNFLLMQLAQENSNVFICDLATIQNKFGRDFCFDSSVYTSTEMVLSLDVLPIIAARTMDIIASLQGKFKKCLIMDLDNTLWGGVIGDDGLEGIQLGHGLGIGKAFTELQLWIKQLKERGIILAVCSKNNGQTAKEPFEKHPEMVLKLDDIAVFIANWETKVSNIMQIQSILNISFDSMVFIDDNPFERNIVRENIQGITVPELPEDPADYLEYLYSLNLFETTSYSSNDKDRTKQYQVEAKRVSERQHFHNEDEFLQSLNMISKVEGFTKFLIPRIAQLTQRSNQFNLRTIRYTEQEITDLEANNEYKNFAFSLEDKFGDNGMICVIVMKKTDGKEFGLDAPALFIDEWLMSCRVLKRGMEHFTLNTLADYAKENGFKYLIGEYIPTQKNSMVKDHYVNLGFSKMQDSENRFVLAIDGYENKKVFIQKA